MSTKKKTSSRARGRAHVKSDRAQAAGKRIRETWNATVQILTSAEAGAERRLRQLLARKRIKPADLRTALAAFRARVQKEQRKAARRRRGENELGPEARRGGAGPRRARA